MARPPSGALKKLRGSTIAELRDMSSAIVLFGTRKQLAHEFIDVASQGTIEKLIKGAYTEEEWFDFMNRSRYGTKNLPEEVLNEYVGDRPLSEVRVHDELEFLCKVHNEHYTRSIVNIMKGIRGCSKCRYERLSLTMGKSKRENKPYPDWFLEDLEDRNSIEGLKSSDKTVFVCNKHGPYEQQITEHLNRGRGCPTCARGVTRENSVVKKISDLLSNLGVEYQQGHRGLIKNPKTGSNLELDFVIKSRSLAIEVNGLYWHSAEHLLNDDKRYTSVWSEEEARNYHKLKTDLCENQGIQLLHIFEDDIRDRFETVSKMIERKLGLGPAPIGARKLNLVNPGKEEAEVLLRENHINGVGRGRLLGLEYRGMLMAVAQIRKAPSNEAPPGCLIIDRYASKVPVVGGLNRIMSAFEKEHPVEVWRTYADRTVSNGGLYLKSGWVEVGRVKPDYTYVYRKKRVHKFNFRISRFREDPDLLYEEGLTEKELAVLNGLQRIYDAGKIKYERRDKP